MVHGGALACCVVLTCVGTACMAAPVVSGGTDSAGDGGVLEDAGPVGLDDAAVYAPDPSVTAASMAQTVDPDGGMPPGAVAFVSMLTLPSAGSMVAVGDVDGDGRVDVLLGDVGPTLGRVGPLRLLHNDGGWVFREMTGPAGLGAWGGWAATLADLDGDGDLDLALGGRRWTGPVGETGALHVFWNDGYGRFRERAGAVSNGGGGGAVPLSVHTADLDGDGRLDILVGRSGTDEVRAYRDQVFMASPEGNFTLTDVGMDAPGFTWFAAAGDIDGDGRPDVVVGNDNYAIHQEGLPADQCPPVGAIQVPPVSWWTRGSYRRAAGDALRFEAVPWFPGFDSVDFTPMAMALADFTGDGRADCYMTLIEAPAMYVQSPGGTFTEGAQAAGLAVQSPDMNSPVGWSALARDVNRDGWLDLLVTHGTIVTTASPAFPNTVHLNHGDGTFTEADRASGFAVPGAWSALAAADLDGDGMEDLVLGGQSLYLRPCDRPERARLIRNATPAGGRHTVPIRLAGTVSNPPGLGARVEVTAGGRTQVYEATAGAATMASSDVAVVAGTGTDTAPSVTVRWPDGYVQAVGTVPVDHALTVHEPRWLALSAAVAGTGSPVTVRLGPEAPGATVRLIGAGRWLAAPSTAGDGARVQTFTADAPGEVALAVSSAAGLHGYARVRFR